MNDIDKKDYQSIPTTDEDLDIVVENKDVVPFYRRRDRLRIILLIVFLFIFVKCIFWYEGNANQVAFMQQQQAMDLKMQEELALQQQQLQLMNARQRQSAALFNKTVTNLEHHTITPLPSTVQPPAPANAAAASQPQPQVPAPVPSPQATSTAAAATTSSGSTSATAQTVPVTSGASATAVTTAASTTGASTAATAGGTTAATPQAAPATAAAKSPQAAPAKSASTAAVPATVPASKQQVPVPASSTVSANTATTTTTTTAATTTNSNQQQFLRGPPPTQKQEHGMKRFWKNVKHWWHHSGQNTVKLSGGGRDWLVEPYTGRIAAKHNPSLYVGVQPKAPLVLVLKGSANQLVFDTAPSAANQNTISLVARNGDHVGLESTTVRYLDQEIRYIPAVVDKTVAPLTVTYVDNNFVYLPDLDLTLDVAWWHLVEGNHVVFAGGPNPYYTMVKGGATGRDWLFDSATGTLSPKGRPDLVLGRGVQGLLLTNQPQEALVFDQADALAYGYAISMFYNNGQNGVGLLPAQQDGAKWIISQSYVTTDSSQVRTVYFDGKFIMLPDETMALEVANWKLQAGTPVNFVGRDGHPYHHHNHVLKHNLKEQQEKNNHHHHPNQNQNQQNHHHPNQQQNHHHPNQNNNNNGGW